MFLHATNVQYLGDYRLEIAFSDGTIKEVDLSAELHGEVFAPLLDKEFFKQVFLNTETNTIEWPNGADLAPEFLHEIGREVREAV